MSHCKLSELEANHDFIHRHIGPSESDIKAMLKVMGFSNLDELIDHTIPRQIRTKNYLKIGTPQTEHELLARLKEIAGTNQVFRSFIGTGFYNTVTPAVILRNMLEDPGWYTAYTPYQPEISQGRLEALLTYQTMCKELTGMDIANSSMLDEGTAAAEAMYLSLNSSSNKVRTFFVSEDCQPHVIEVLKTRTKALGVELIVGNHEKFDFSKPVFGVCLQYPNTRGTIHDYSEFIARAHTHGALVTLVADILSLTVLKSPGELGADIAVGSTQRLGIPIGYGGPHAAFFATKDKYKRTMPGRLVGMSKDSKGRPALRLALQTREQHIRREKATSNICTAQVLLANMAGMYAVYHGPEGLKRIAQRVHRLTTIFAEGLKHMGFKLESESYFDTLSIPIGSGKMDAILKVAESKKINLRKIDGGWLGVSFDEVTSRQDVMDLWQVFNEGKAVNLDIDKFDSMVQIHLPQQLMRTSKYLEHAVFQKYHSETEILRYIQSLQEKDLSLVHAMIPLGSCTMKLNATSEMLPISWPEFANIHPYAPVEQAQGYQKMMNDLKTWLADITGFDAVTLQPNAGSQGEYTGLLVIRKYHEKNGQGRRNICLIPSSAHGTNPASAAMAGMKVVVVACDERGNIDVNDLRLKAEQNKNELAALMVTYPSTHGVFEETIMEICEIIHANGGQVYLDGANMNALVGLCKPAEFGGDVCHLNLHKTFAIPHGGGGPGVGPIGVKAHLKEFLPTHSLVAEAGPRGGSTAVASGPFGSASVLPISWMYIALMGSEGLKKATEVAILNANYIAKRLENHYPVLYKGKEGLIAHECILDTRHFKVTADISVDDIAKRLMDYGFHAPTMSFPVAGTLMVEPTESESRYELDRFIEAMIKIREEIALIESGKWDKLNNPLKNAPHCLADIASAQWNHPYSREEAVYPVPQLRERRFWTPVSRVDNAYGDRNLMCACPPPEFYAQLENQ